MLLRTLAAADPAATALADERRAVTYGDLGELLERERDWLVASTSERFALLADNGVAWAIADLALHVGGLFSVPLPGSFTDALTVHALDDAGIDTLLTDDVPRAQRLPGWRLDGATPASGLFRFRRELDSSQRPVVAHGTGKVTYTSGSTSRPRGVCLAGGSLESVATAVACATAQLDIERHLCLLPLATLLENVAGLYAPLLRGATCLVPSCSTTGIDYAGLDVARLAGVVASLRPNSLILVPELLQALVAAAERGWRAPTSLRFVAVGGARVSPALLARADTAGIPVFEGYGLSECASVVCLNTPQARRAGAVGRPLSHVRVRVDAQGQVHVAGNTMLGYLGAAPLPAGAEFATGDLGRFDDDGFLQLQGRQGNRFITSFGRNVSPEWVESEVAQRLDGRPVLACGEARPYVVALVGVAADEADDAAVTRAIAAANAALPVYAQVRHWARTDQPFSFADGTLTANGRPRRSAILARHRDRIDALYTEAAAS
ncbi:MAG TPA: AMP-binding protein [Steroidobacteraceae bacterium]|nr:AMP-binding protein [Steroidobacteraceae bacterium]